MKKCLLAILLISWSLALPAQDPFSSLEERMTAREFKGAGLDKLTNEELQALNAWLQNHSVATLKNATVVAIPENATEPTGDQRGLETKKVELSTEEKTIESRIAGTFTGWDGITVFKLENGMVWRQSEKDVFRIKAVENPMVTIKKGLFGTWRLSVEGFNSRVKVKRLQ